MLGCDWKENGPSLLLGEDPADNNKERDVDIVITHNIVCSVDMTWYIYIYIYMWVRSWRCGCLVTWFCYHLIAEPGNKTAAPSWPDIYIYIYIYIYMEYLAQNCCNTIKYVLIENCHLDKIKQPIVKKVSWHNDLFNIVCSISITCYRWLSTRLQQLYCYCTGVTVVLC